MNLYTAIVSRLLGSTSIGTIRSDIDYEVEGNGFWGPWLLRTPSVLIANSVSGERNAMRMGISKEKLHVIPNVLDLDEFDQQAKRTTVPFLAIEKSILVFSVGSFIAAKRLDRFMNAIALAKQKYPPIRGILIGEGPERSNLIAQAKSLGLDSSDVLFLGSSDQVPALLRKASLFMLTSDHEGFPNVILEAMASKLPVITTPAGDANLIVQDRITGFVVPFDDFKFMADCLVDLANSPRDRERCGEAGRSRVENNYSFRGLSSRLLEVYFEIAERQEDHRLLQAINQMNYVQA